MKKFIVILAVLLMASPSYAALFTSDSTTEIGGADLVPSTNVTVDIESDVDDYMAAAKHQNGDNVYHSGAEEADITAIDCGDAGKGEDMADGQVTDEDTVVATCQYQ